MKHVMVALLATFFCSTAIADVVRDANAKVYEYFELFNARDKQKVANEIYSTPLHIGSGDGHRVLATPGAAVDNLDGLYEVITGRGWKESRISDLSTCVLSDSMALVDTQYSRLGHDGEPIPPALRTVLYVLQKIAGEWRIVAFYSHDNDRRPACD